MLCQRSVTALSGRDPQRHDGPDGRQLCCAHHIAHAEIATGATPLPMELNIIKNAFKM